MNRLLSAVLMLLCLATQVWSLGDEQLGNDPLSGANYESPAGILPVLNDTHRVYRWWVNGNEKFFFRGDTIALNAALEEFAKIESDRLEVVLRPGPAKTSTFHRDTEVPYNWHLHLIGGIVGHMSKSDKGDNVWPTHPILYIYIGGKIQLSDLAIPGNVTVLQLADLKKRYTDSLSSTDRTVRGWTCGELAALDRYSEKTMVQVASMLKDEENWVRLNAAGALVTYGTMAKKVLPKLQAAGETEDERLKQRITETLEKIVSAESDARQQEKHAKMVKAIASYCAARAGN